MNTARINHIEFVPNILIKENNFDGIYVISHRKNKRSYKKGFILGAICYNKKTNEYMYIHLYPECGLSLETLFIITRFIRELNDGVIIFDSEKGEITKCENKK